MVIASERVNAQCSTCTPVFGNCPADGGLCNSLGTGYANNNYDQTINFYMPHKLTNAAVLAQCSCSYVDLNSITITGVSGLPVGLTYTMSNNGQYNVQGGDTTGCIHFCGVPLLPGTYPITVNLLANVVAVGTAIGDVPQNNVPQQYKDTLIILPDTIPGVSSFSYGNNGSVACDSITITLQALYSATVPNLTGYSWELPGGQTSNLKSPGSFTFVNTSNVPDTFPITLTTVFYDYVVTEVYIDSVVGGYCGDVEEISCDCGFWGSPDPYVTFPALGFNNRTTGVTDKCKNVNYDSLLIAIPIATSSIKMTMWDQDVASADDSLGSYSINVSTGKHHFSNINAGGWVYIDTVPGTTLIETLYVIVNPAPPTPLIVVSQDTFCNNDSVLISATSGPYTYEWFYDTIPVLNETGSSFYTSTSGHYKVIATDQNTGCASKPSNYTAIIGEQAPAANIAVVHVGNQLYVTPFAGGLKVRWYYNGNLLADQTGAVISSMGDGTYAAVIYNPAYPECNTIAKSDTIISGINETYITDFSLNIMPNPNNGDFKVQFYSGGALDIELNVRNILGQLVYSKRVENFSGKFDQEINLDVLEKGMYVVSVECPSGRQYRQIIVQ